MWFVINVIIIDEGFVDLIVNEVDIVMVLCEICDFEVVCVEELGFGDLCYDNCSWVLFFSVLIFVIEIGNFVKLFFVL